MGEILALSALAMFSASVLLTKVASSRVELNLGFLVAVTVNFLFCGLLLVIQLLLRHQDQQWSSYGFLLFLATGVFSTYLGRYRLSVPGKVKTRRAVHKRCVRSLRLNTYTKEAVDKEER